MSADSPTSHLLRADEPSPYEIIAPRGDVPVLLVADHASARMPAAVNQLGLDAVALNSHLASDLGSRALTLALADALGFGAVLCRYSRLVVDCNRSLDDPSAYLTFSDGTSIPGNRELSQSERRRRADAIYWPYHEQVAAQLAALETAGQSAVLVSIHSFTPVLDGIPRPWDAGLLWDKDERLAQALLDGLSAIPGLRVGDNVPYSGRSSADYTVDYHGEAARRAHVALEVRQDHIATPAGVAEWAGRLAVTLTAALGDPALFSPFSPPSEPQLTLRAESRHAATTG